MNIQIKEFEKKKSYERKQQFQNMFLLTLMHNFWDFIHVIICIMLVVFYSYCLITISYWKYHITTHVATTGLKVSPSVREKLIWYIIFLQYFNITKAKYMYLACIILDYKYYI